ncbi:STM4011 family radical SAM protein [Blastopirellula marina]|uniref:Radical SAM protein n=1 Tax=Blastopirellula marina TaxID=124 RepID=A0A2S8GFE3_9BACT|nr:STM4011 family radical SAM protein [Blastopirellula marina]PQO30130.1 radical SAM protein [Blastopirellula marina]PQO43182.1 radical SAM protein [Blastopirellula marina]PTL42568.1 radical SAM protein [Blastopirellula marina]
MNARYHVLYRGPLSSCNYGCTYCPFAKRDETYAQLEGDRESLSRFLGWIERQTSRRFGVLFTPWGEALVRTWYQEALERLSWMPHVDKAAIQTNLSCRLNWLDRCQADRIALWSTFHPTETTLAKFCRRVEQVAAKGVRISVGCVGLKENVTLIEELRATLPAEIYVWVNAYKRQIDYYDAMDIARLQAVDPHFHLNNVRHASLGQGCHAGETSFTVDGNGDLRRCHFVDRVIGNIADPTWEEALQVRACPNQSCGCHIGYVHMKRLDLYPLYGDGLLERIPAVSPGELRTIPLPARKASCRD